MSIRGVGSRTPKGEAISVWPVDSVGRIIQEEVREREEDANNTKMTTSEVITNMIEAKFESKNETRGSIIEFMHSLLPDKNEIFDPTKHLAGEELKKFITEKDYRLLEERRRSFFARKN